MPLHAENPRGTAGQFYSFDNAVGRMCCDAKAVPRFQNRLVMRAVYIDFAAPRHLGEVTALNLCRMKGVRQKFVMIVLEMCRQLAGNVLNKAAAKMYVEGLQSETYRQQRFARSQGLID